MLNVYGQLVMLMVRLRSNWKLRRSRLSATNKWLLWNI